jgi:ribosomal protein S18 acetylase RimI-like enzyme
VTVIAYRRGPMLKIERLTASEGARLRTIRLRALSDAPDMFGTTYEETEARPAESFAQQLEDLATFVAVDDGRDVGLVRGGPHESLENAAYLISMWVAPEVRGQGIGIALIDAVVRWAKQDGYARVVLDVGTHNVHAIALYARAGFIEGGEPLLPPPRVGVVEIQMSLSL